MTEETAETVKSKHPRSWWRRKRVWIPLAAMIAFLAGVGPWPTYSASHEDAPYARATFAHARQADYRLVTGPLEVGIGQADITPRPGDPLAGYGGRPDNHANAPLDALRAEAISLRIGRRTITLVGGDILLFLPRLRHAVLERTGLPEDDVFFTATHTHAGPGGYEPGWIHQFVLGPYDQAILDRLAEAFASAIRRSYSALSPAAMRTRVISPPQEAALGYCLNRIEPGGPPHGTLAIAVFREKDPAGKVLGSLVIASPHPTCHSSSNVHPTADYPGVVKRAIEKRLGGTCLFAIGATGSMRASKNAPKGVDRARDVGRSILRALDQGGAMDPDAPFASETAIGSARLEVRLPPQQYRVTDGLRLTPHFTSIAHDRDSYVQAVRLGRLVLLGMPADYSGELAMTLEKDFSGDDLQPVITSLNGDYIGYVVPKRRYHLVHYETRDMNFFGPWCGEYLNRVAYLLVQQADRDPTPE